MSDLIDRQAAVEVIDAAFPVDPMKSEYAQGIACGVALAKTYVEQLPSAQSEIIYCKDCTRYEKKSGRCNLVDGLNVATANSFCSYAERRQKNG